MKRKKNILDCVDTFQYILYVVIQYLAEDLSLKRKRKSYKLELRTPNIFSGSSVKWSDSVRGC